MPIRGLLRAIKIHVSKLGEGSRVAKLELLSSGQTHDAIELNSVLRQLVIRCNRRLLALLILNLPAEFVEADANASFAPLSRLVEERLRSVLLRLLVGQVGLVG